jgi:hypothetical protein
MALDSLFQSIGANIVHPTCANSVNSSLAAADVSESQVVPASIFLDQVYGDGMSARGSSSRAQTPMMVGPLISLPGNSPPRGVHSATLDTMSSASRLPVASTPRGSNLQNGRGLRGAVSSFYNHYMRASAKGDLPLFVKDTSFLSVPASGSRPRVPRPSALPQLPTVEGLHGLVDRAAEYVLVVSMYEVYNDRIFDLLASSASTTKSGLVRRRALLFKSTEMSPDRKVVAGLKKIVCCSLEEARMVLETGLLERKVAGTGSNAVSSRSHGFFCVEVKKRSRVQKGRWESSTLTVVDLAGRWHHRHSTKDTTY